MPSQDEIDQHQQDIEELSTVAVAAVTAAVMAADGEDADASLVRTIPATLTPYISAAADLAAEWYRGLARERPEPVPARRRGAPAPIVGPRDRISLLDAAEFEPEPAELPPREQIEATVRWAVYQPAVDLTPVPSTEPVTESGGPGEPAQAAESAGPEPTVRQQAPAPRPRAPEPTEQNAPEPARPPESENQRARVIPAEETDLRATVIPADASEHQASVINRLAGATQRYVTSAARDTITQNADLEGVRYVRHAQADACAFCRMLAIRGPEYLSAQSARRVVGRNGRPRGKRKVGELYHDWCQCQPVAVRAGDSWDPPDHVVDWNDQYEKAVAKVGNRTDTRRILAEMRAAERSGGGSSH